MRNLQLMSIRSLPRSRIMVLATILLTCLAGLAVGAARSSPAQAASVDAPATARYLGVWNYDQPNSKTMTNIAVISCPAGSTNCAGTPPISIPQIGTVTFSAGPAGTVTGRTDQGCTWRFAAHPGGLELSPSPQYCFNHVIGSGYTITRWSITFSGQHEKEYITAVSHLPYGNYAFVLKNGRRTKAVNGPEAARRFTGTWQYDTADPGTGLNTETTVYTEPGGELRTVKSTLSGQITFTARRGGLITARTADGCAWTLAVAGNTAELQPAEQECKRGGVTTAMSFWSIASNGRQQVAIIAGTNAKSGKYLATNTSLTRVGLQVSPARPARS